MEISSAHAAELMDDVLRMQEYAHNLMVEMSVLAGFYRRRVIDLAAGDLVGFGANEWKLVVDAVPTATAEGDGVVVVSFVDDDERSFDPLDIVDVKAEPILSGF